jgi:hypothetical protein
VPRMKRLFSGTVRVHYCAMYFQGGASEMPEEGQYFEGQVNGLCGAGERSYLLLITGLHTGGVKVTIDPGVGRGVVGSHRLAAGQVSSSVLWQKHGCGPTQGHVVGRQGGAHR